MQKDFNRLRTGFVGVCAALALIQGCINDVKYVKLHQEYQRHLKTEAEFLQDLVLILQNGHLDPAQIVSKFEKVELSGKEYSALEIRALEIDFDRQVLKINGEPVTKPVLVTLPGEEGWPLRLLFNHECQYVFKGKCDELEVIYSAGDQ